DGRFLPVRTVDPLGNASTVEYNEFNQITAVVDALGHRREFTYDPDRFDLIGIFEAGPIAQSFEYDSNHRLLVSTDPLGHTTRYAYAGDSLSATRSTDPLGFNTARGYDERGAVVSTPDAVGSATKWTYGPRGELHGRAEP